MLNVPPRPAARHIRARPTRGMPIKSSIGTGRGKSGGWLITFGPDLYQRPTDDGIADPDLGDWRREVPCEVPPPSICRIDGPEWSRLHVHRRVSYLWWLVNRNAKTLTAFERALTAAAILMRPKLGTGI